MFTAQGGHETEYFEELPEFLKTVAWQRWVRIPKAEDEARHQVDDLKKAGVDGIKAILEAGQADRSFNRLNLSLLQAVAEESRLQDLPLVVHTGDSHDVADALRLGANGIEHGSFRDRIPEEVLVGMAQAGIVYDPTLSVVEAFDQLLGGKDDLLNRSLVQQVGPLKLIQETRKALHGDNRSAILAKSQGFHPSLELAKENLLKAYQAGVKLVTGSDAGNPLVIHGPTIHRELQLWVEAGIPAEIALQAATCNAARLLRPKDSFGLIKKGHDANLLLVDGNPLKDISATERISLVIYKGERLNRSKLLEQE